jgi:hypothetical protein
MKYTANDKQYEGTPQEIADFISLTENIPYIPSEGTAEPNYPEMEPLQNIVSESEKLRGKLAIDPTYNPFGGVVPPKDSIQDKNIPIVDSNLDTGVELIG